MTPLTPVSRLSATVKPGTPYAAAAMNRYTGTMVSSWNRDPKESLPNMFAQLEQQATNNLKPVYLGDLAARFLKKLDERRAYIRKNYQRKHWLTYKLLAKRSGLGYEAVMRYLCRKDREMGFTELDKLLFASGLSVLDLLMPSEVLSYLESLDYKQRNDLRENFRILLDRHAKQVSNSVSGKTDSQTQ